MGAILDIKGGPLGGSKIPVGTESSILIGRASDRVQFAIPHDSHMSGVHFGIECGPQGCRVLDKKSSNGTFLNGARIQEAMLADGDEIKAGETIFSVKIVAEDKLPSMVTSISASLPREKTKSAPAEPALRAAPPLRVAAPSQPPARPMVPAKETSSADRAAAVNQPHRSAPSVSSPHGEPISKPVVPKVAGATGKSLAPAFSVMGWSFNRLPEQWEVKEGFGLQRTGNNEFPSSVIATQEHLGGISLQQFVESQISMLRQYLMNPTIQPVVSPRIDGADECVTVDVHHHTKDGKELVYRRIYARGGVTIGILTVTALAADLPQVVKSLQALFEGANFRSTSAPQ